MRKRITVRDGITYHCFETDQWTQGEAAVKDRKLTLNGRGSLTVALDQWKYPDQGIAQIYNRNLTQYESGPRAAVSANRVQIWFNIEEYLDMMRATLKEFA